MPVLICIDRDGTLVKDEDYFLGSTPDWKEKIEFLPGVVAGLRLLSKIQDVHLFIVTNQAGVALQGPAFNLLTEERAQEVTQYIVDFLQKQGIHMEGYFVCPYVDQAYVEKSVQRGRTVNPQYVKENHPDLKPNPGMIEKAAKTIGTSLAVCNVYMLGDRLSDVETGLRAGGTSYLLLSSRKALDDVPQAEALQRQYPGRVFIKHSFDQAAQAIMSNSVDKKALG